MRPTTAIVYTFVGLAAAYGYFMGFVKYGPSYRQYTKGIEEYALTYLRTPQQSLPFPQPEHTLNKTMILFMSAKGHPLFQSQNQSWIRASLGTHTVKPRAVLLADSPSNSQGYSFPIPSGRKLMLIEALLSTREANADAVILKVGSDKSFVLRRIDSSLAEHEIPANSTVYSGLIPVSEAHTSKFTFMIPK